MLGTSGKLVSSTDRSNLSHWLIHSSHIRIKCLIWLSLHQVSAVINNLVRSSLSLRYLQQLFLLMITVRKHLLILLGVANKLQGNYSDFMTRDNK